MSRCELQCTVRVAPLPEQSDPDEGVHAWAYTIRIENRGELPAQVVARHWLIEDENGRREEVRGLGIVGRQPLLQPGEQHEYTSWVQLRTPRGSMHGVYLCMSAEAEPFEATIPLFQLGDAPILH